MNQKNLKNIGYQGENIAVQYLKQNNYDIIERRWQKKEGEIDIVAFDRLKNYLVFIEVKTRTSNTFGSIEESISIQKMEKWENIVKRYIIDSKFKGDFRLDAIFLLKKDTFFSLKHLENVYLK